MTTDYDLETAIENLPPGSTLTLADGTTIDSSKSTDGGVTKSDVRNWMTQWQREMTRRSDAAHRTRDELPNDGGGLSKPDVRKWMDQFYQRNTSRRNHS